MDRAQILATHCALLVTATQAHSKAVNLLKALETNREIGIAIGVLMVVTGSPVSRLSTSCGSRASARTASSPRWPPKSPGSASTLDGVVAPLQARQVFTDLLLRGGDAQPSPRGNSAAPHLPMKGAGRSVG